MRLLDLLIKGAGHKYIKRIPVGTTKTGKVRYRYIYSSTHTVGGKNILDEAHLKPGTKLMLHSKDGAEVHAHIDSVDGDQVTFTYDDGDRKGETRTVSKQKLLAEFDQEHKAGEQIESAKAALLADIKGAAERGLSQKQLARLVDRLKRLGGEMEQEQEEKPKPKPKRKPKPKPKSKPVEEPPKDSAKEKILEPKKLDPYQEAVLNAMRLERNYSASTVDSLNKLHALTGDTAAEVASAISARKAEAAAEGKASIYSFPSGGKMAVLEEEDNRYTAMLRTPDGGQRIHIEVKGAKSREAAARAAITAIAVSSPKGDSVVLEDIEPGEVKDRAAHLTTLKDLEADIPRMEAITGFDTIEGQTELITHSQEPAESYTAIPAPARKVLDSLSSQAKAANRSERPAIDRDGEVSVTNGITIFSAKINAESVDASQAYGGGFRRERRGFAKDGSPVDLLLSPPPFSDVKDNAKAQTVPAFSLDAAAARKLHDMFSAQHKDNANPVTIEPSAEGMLDITFMGKQLAQVKDHRPPGEYEPVAITAPAFRDMVSVGASTFHLPTKTYDTRREARKASTRRKGYMLRSESAVGDFVTAGAAPDVG